MGSCGIFFPSSSFSFPLFTLCGCFFFSVLVFVCPDVAWPFLILMMSEEFSDGEKKKFAINFCVSHRKKEIALMSCVSGFFCVEDLVQWMYND